MGEIASAGIARVLKIVFYLTVITASSCMLYGLVDTARPLDECAFGGSVCVLFGDFGKVIPANSYSVNQTKQSGAANQTSPTPASQTSQVTNQVTNHSGSCVPDTFKGYKTSVGGNDQVCQICTASAAVQLVLAVVACILVVCRMRRRSPGRSAWSVPELIIVVLLFLISLATAIMVTTGLLMFCDRLTGGWDDSDSIYNHLGIAKPADCKDAALTMDGLHASVKFYKTMNLAKVAAWVAAAAWGLHFFLSLCGAVSFRRHGSTTPRDTDKENSKKEKKDKKSSQKKKPSVKKTSAWETDKKGSRIV